MAPYTLEDMGAVKDKKTYSFGLQVLGFGGAVWICNSTRSMSRDKIREAFSLQDKMGTWRGGHSLPNGKSSTEGKNYHVFMDNYFTSFRLLVHLSEHEIKATAVLSQKKLNNCIIMGNKAFEKKTRGHVDQRKSTNQGVRGIIVTRQNKNRAV